MTNTPRSVPHPEIERLKSDGIKRMTLHETLSSRVDHVYDRFRRSHWIEKMYLSTNSEAYDLFDNEKRYLMILEDCAGVVNLRNAWRSTREHPTLCLEYVEAWNLARLIDEDIVPVEVYRNVIPAIGKTLLELSSRNIVHNDIKPGNILVHQHTDQVILVDFGIASGVCGTVPSCEGFVRGTYRYISPQRVISGVGSSATDVYSYSLVAFEVLVDVHPYDVVFPWTASNRELAEAIATISGDNLDTLEGALAQKCDDGIFARAWRNLADPAFGTCTDVEKFLVEYDRVFN